MATLTNAGAEGVFPLLRRHTKKARKTKTTVPTTPDSTAIKVVAYALPSEGKLGGAIGGRSKKGADAG